MTSQSPPLITRPLRIFSFNSIGTVIPYAMIDLHETLRQMGHIVHVFDPTKYPDPYKLNMEPLQELMAFKPDLVLTIDLVGLVQYVFGIFPHIPFAAWFFDNPSKYIPNDSILGFPNFFVFSIDKIFAEKMNRKNVIYLPFGTNEEVFKPRKLKNKYDVSFIGSYQQGRAELFKKISKKYHIHIWGDEAWKNVQVENISFHGYAHHRNDAPKIYNQSKIVLSLNADQFDNGISERLYNIMACEAFALTEPSEVLKETFKIGKELDIFSDAKSCIEKIDFYLNNEDLRLSCAKAGCRKVTNSFTFKHLVPQIITKVAENPIYLSEILTFFSRFKKDFYQVCKSYAFQLADPATKEIYKKIFIF